MRKEKHIDFLKVTSVINSCIMHSHAVVASKMIEVFAIKYGMHENHFMIRQLNALLVIKTTPSPFMRFGKFSFSYFMPSPELIVEQETAAWHLEKS